MEEIALKLCTRCRNKKPATRDFFYACPSSRDRLQTRCKECMRGPAPPRTRKRSALPDQGVSENEEWLAGLMDQELDLVYGMSCLIRKFHPSPSVSEMHEDLRRELDVRGHHPHHYDESSDNRAVTEWLKNL
jgi:hypothetical protein